MRTVESRWRNVAAGYQKACQLEADLRTRWLPRIEQVHRRQAEIELAEWESHRQRRAQEHQHALSAWTQAVAEQQERLPAIRASDRHRARLVVPAAMVLAAVVSLLSDGTDQLLLMVFLGLCAGLAVAFVPTMGQAARIAQLKSGRPPEPPDEPKPRQKPVMSLLLVDQWWSEIADNGRRAGERSEYGDEGEDLLFRHLTAALPDNHLGARSVLVRRRLDVDVLVVGPTAVWVFEVKHWSGTITCRRGTWLRTRTYHGPGGVLQQEQQQIKGFDQQWVRERTEVAETLRRRLSPSPPALDVRGGIVFTHPGVTFNLDGSVRCGFGGTGYWTERLCDVPKDQEVITTQLRLAVIDALFNRADSITGGPGGNRCSVELAERLSAARTDEVTRYLSAHGG